jgi:hypothetical protein
MANDNFKEFDKETDAYVPSEDEVDAIKECLDSFSKGKAIITKGYNYFQGSQLSEVVDDWTKRWNGYIPPSNPLLDQTQSQIFVNFTQQAIISYLSKVALSPVKAHIIAVNKKTGLIDQKFADVLEDLNTYSLRAENADAKFLQAALECATKGTVVVYEGYKKVVQKMKTPKEYDSVTGKIIYKEEDRVIYDNCYQEVVPLEDFYISNPFEPDVQKQYKVIWRKVTSYSEAKDEFKKYKNWKYVKPGSIVLTVENQTFYREELMNELGKDQAEILRYYCRSKNQHIVLVNGVVMYDGPIPFKDGKYPFAKTVNQPFANDFFWGNGHPNKYMGEQDLVNTFINAMADKTIASTMTTGLSSDLDDLIEDDTIEAGKWRKVGDINNWKYLESPQVGQGEFNMFQQVMNLAKENANVDAGSQTTPRGGKMQTRQIMMKQQEIMQKIAFNMGFLEDLERDRTELRLSHILQFYSIGKIEKITGKGGKEVEQLTYRELQLDTKLSNGKQGTRVIKIIGDEYKNADSRKKLQDELSVKEMMGEKKGTPTEAIAISIDTFNDFNNSIQVVKNSSYERNQALDQAKRIEFAQWRLSVAEAVPLGNPKELIAWVEESYDVDTDRFESAPPGVQNKPMGAPGVPGQQPGATPGPAAQVRSTVSDNSMAATV